MPPGNNITRCKRHSSKTTKCGLEHSRRPAPGRVIKVTGDDLLATFDGPDRAIRCAIALGEAGRPLGVEIRAGLHTGEVEVMGDDVGSIAVHIEARVTAEARPGEVLVSGAVPPLVAGSGIEFDDRVEHELKCVPGTGKLFAVEG